MSYLAHVGVRGIAPAQHHDEQWEQEVRIVEWSARIVDRDEYGNYIFADDSVGDEICRFLWERSTRATSGWSNVWPVVLGSSGGGGQNISGGGEQGAGFTFSDVRTDFSQGDPNINLDFGVGQFSNGAAGAGIDVGLLNATTPQEGGAAPPAQSRSADGQGDVGTKDRRSSCGGCSGAAGIVPVYSAAWDPDLRFKPKVANAPPGYPKPHGGYGIALAGTHEWSQEELFFQIDPRLIAVNAGGDVKAASQVCDMSGCNIDPSRVAPLQSAFWVLRAPGGSATIALNIGATGCGDNFGGLVIDAATGGAAPAAPDPATAPDDPGITQTADGSGADEAGQTITSTLPQFDDRVAAFLSMHDGGFVDVGSGKCRHVVGMDADGHIITGGAHITTNANFRRNDTEDGPLRFTTYKEGDEFESVSEVNLGWAGADWAWWTTSPFHWDPHIWDCCEWDPKNTVHTPGGRSTRKPLFTPSGKSTQIGGAVGVIATPAGRSSGQAGAQSGATTGAILQPRKGPTEAAPVSTKPGSSTRPPDEDPEPAPGTNAWAEWNKRRKQRREDRKVYGDAVSQWDPSTGPRALLTTAQEIAMPGLLARPQAFTGNQTDVRNRPGVSTPGAQRKRDTTVPVTGQLAAFSGEGGTVTDGYTSTTYGAEGDPHIYTQRPGSSKYSGGTGPGGWVFLPPEVGLEDASAGFTPTVGDVSEVYFMAGPGAWFGVGVPEIANGGLAAGYSFGRDDSNGDLLFRSHAADTLPDTAVKFTNTAQNIAWASGTAFFGTIDHVISADRTWTFPNKSGTVALLDDVPTILTAYKTTNQSVINSTTPVNDNELGVTVVASTTYSFKLRLFLTTNSTTAGYRFELSGTATIFDMKAQVTIYDDVTDAIAGSTRVTALDSPAGAVPSSGVAWAVVEGTVLVNAGGTFVLQFAQQVVDAANSVTVQAGSEMEAIKVG